MKTAAQLVTAGALLASTLLAFSAFAQTRPSNDALPPPSINDPGTQAVAPARDTAAQSSAVEPKSAQSTALPAMHDDGTARDARNEPPPEVNVYQRGTNHVQEYTRNGQVYMVVITPKVGIAQTYMVDPQGRVMDEHGQKPVGPVMYKVLEWGKSKPAAAPSSTPPAPPADLPAGSDTDSGH